MREKGRREAGEGPFYPPHASPNLHLTRPPHYRQLVCLEQAPARSIWAFSRAHRLTGSHRVCARQADSSPDLLLVLAEWQAATACMVMRH
jgi:hypothetical protein